MFCDKSPLCQPTPTDAARESRDCLQTMPNCEEKKHRRCIKPRAESSLLELCRGAKEEEPPLGGSKRDLGGMSIFFNILVSAVFGFRMLSKIAQCK